MQALAETLVSLQQPKGVGSFEEDVIPDPLPQKKTVGADEDKAVDRFCKNKPKEFPGLESTSEVEDWLLDLEQMFDSLKTLAEIQVKCTTFFLRGSARKWWRSSPEASNPDLDWTTFRNKFIGHYLPAS